MYRLITLTFVATVVTGCGGRPSTTQDNRPATSTQVPDPVGTSESSTELPETNKVAPQLTTEQTEFGDKWKAASQEERRAMADVAKVHMLFQGATRTQIKEAFGQADETGIDKFGDDVTRYELGAVPEADGGGQYHLTFVYENDTVVRVMGNFVSIAP